MSEVFTVMISGREFVIRETVAGREVAISETSN